MSEMKGGAAQFPGASHRSLGLSNYTNLSKSKLLTFRQCPKRLWLEVHRQELQTTTLETEARFQVGYEVGGIARRLYDQNGRGTWCSAVCAVGVPPGNGSDPA